MAESIGDFTFVCLKGQPGVVQQEIELITRPGVDGTGLLRTGRRGQPFDLETGVDTQTLEAGRTLFNQYKALSGTDPVKMVWGAINLETAESVLFGVLRVDLISLRPIAASVGGLNPPSGAWLQCRWNLIPIEKVTP